MQITRKASHLRAKLGNWIIKLKTGAWVFIRIMLSTGVFKHSCFIHQIFYLLYFFQANLWT